MALVANPGRPVALTLSVMSQAYGPRRWRGPRSVLWSVSSPLLWRRLLLRWLLRVAAGLLETAGRRALLRETAAARLLVLTGLLLLRVLAGLLVLLLAVGLLTVGRLLLLLGVRVGLAETADLAVTGRR